MKKTLFIFSCVFTILLTIISGQSTARELPKPQTIALYFYADWCPNCQKLTPKYEKVRTQALLDRKNILFVKLDLTDKPRIHQSILLAQGLGLGAYIQQQGSATGYVAFLNANTKEEKFRITSADSIEIIQNNLQNLP